MTEQLKPCPFCGSPARLNRSKGESLWSHDQVEWTQVQCTNEDCGVATENRCEGWEPEPIESWNTRALTTSQPAQAGEVDERVAFKAALSRDDFERFREWFDCIQDVHVGYLDRRDYELAKKLYTALGMRVPSSINTRASLPTQPAAQAAPEQNAETAGLLSATGHLSTLLNESTQMLAQLRALVDALHNQWSNGGAPERGEYPLLDRVDDWLGARPPEMLSHDQATPTQQAAGEPVGEHVGTVVHAKLNGQAKPWVTVALNQDADLPDGTKLYTHPAPGVPEGLDEDQLHTVALAADLLEHYAAYINEVKPDDIERHPYLPEIELTAADLRVLSKRGGDA